MGISLKNLRKWIEDNEDYLRITEILAPLWDGSPHLTIRIESPNWKKVKTASCVEPILRLLKEDEAIRIPAILKTMGHKVIQYPKKIRQSTKQPHTTLPRIALKIVP